ncbi:hypothetical protein, partial [Escherichia coli]|uniref:hypothetical protein n=1 Tax=Escherichia coli TaxID=562 RepID=UPI001BD09FF4
RSFYLFFVLFLVFYLGLLGIWQDFVPLNSCCLVIKIVKLMFFAIKHRDNLRRRKQDGSSVNTFLLSGFMSSFVWLYFWKDINEQQ